MRKFPLISRLLCCLLLSLRPSLSWAQEEEQALKKVFGALATEKFTFHEPTYFILGNDDLKLQYSFKYRLSKGLNLYFAYTQVMFWSIYDDSRPFKDVNYRPEVFYRLWSTENDFLKSIDLGLWHFSNGEKGELSRSLDQLFVRSTVLTKVRRHRLGAVLKIYRIFEEDQYNKNIVDHLGHWEINLFLTDVVLIGGNSIDLVLRAHAGSKVFDLDQGATEFGVSYNFKNSDINPSIYFQRFNGFAENLREYDQKSTEYRLGFILSF